MACGWRLHGIPSQQAQRVNPAGRGYSSMQAMKTGRRFGRLAGNMDTGIDPNLQAVAQSYMRTRRRKSRPRKRAADDRRMHDEDVRKAMWGWLHEHWAEDGRNPEEALFTDELVATDEVRADIAIISPDMMEGFELKSECDTLDRLPHQVEGYSKIFDQCSLVCADRLYAQGSAMVPAWWGLFRATGESGHVRITCERQPGTNPHPDLWWRASLMWVSECKEVLARHGMLKGLKSKTRAFLWDALSEKLDGDTLSKEVRMQLLSRGDMWRRSVWDSGRRAGTAQADKSRQPPAEGTIR